MPLTTTGIAILILSSLRAHHDHPDDCSVNDCKVAVNHLIRKFSEPLGKMGESQVKQSKDVLAGAGGNTIKDHAVPVIVLLEQLLRYSDSHLVVSKENIARLETFLRKSLLIVEITREEDLKLSKSGFQRNMPENWNTEEDPLYQDPLARYKICGIDI